MLARLDELDGIERAETDVAGDLLRLSLRDEVAVGSAIELLVALGYGAEPAIDTGERRWYDRRSVGALSRIEADIIAARIVSRYAAARGGALGDSGRVGSAIADALHACFVTEALGATPSTGEFRARCVERTVAAVRPIVGDDAELLGRLLDDDLSQVHGGHR